MENSNLKEVTQSFDEHKVHYKAISDNEIVVYANVKDEHSIPISFLFPRHKAIRVIAKELVSDIQQEKRTEYLEFLNDFNSTYTCLKAGIFEDSVYICYDIPINTSSKCIGDVVYEVYFRILSFLAGDEYFRLRNIESRNSSEILNELLKKVRGVKAESERSDSFASFIKLYLASVDKE